MKEEAPIVNLSIRFLLPLLTVKPVDFRQLFATKLLLGVYANKEPQEDSNVIVLTLRKDYTEIELEKFTKCLKRGFSYINIINEERFPYLVLEIGLSQQRDVSDYNCFLSGQYSLFSNEHKERILAFWKLSKNHLIHGILFKTELAEKYWANRMGVEFVNQIKQKGLDYWSKPCEDKEKFNATSLSSNKNQ